MISKIKIALTDDHSLLRESLKNLLESDTRFEVIIEASNGQDLLDQLHNGVFPDIILMDISMPVLDGISATKIIKQQYNFIKIIALTMNDQKKFFDIFKQIGGEGFITKDSDPIELFLAISQVNEGRKYFTYYN